MVEPPEFYRGGRIKSDGFLFLNSFPNYFCIFFKKFNKPLVTFFRVWTKNANCLEILRKFWKFLMKILLKNWIFIFIFYFIFYFIFRKFVTKNRAFRNNTIFLQKFVRFRGGGFPLSPFPLNWTDWFDISITGISFLHL